MNVEDIVKLTLSTAALSLIHFKCNYKDMINDNAYLINIFGADAFPKGGFNNAIDTRSLCRDLFFAFEIT